MSKRSSVLESATSLVEIDLLRGGQRLPTRERLRPADCYVFICRGCRRPQADVYAWNLPQPLPTVPIPLAADDPDAALDLQAVLTRVYDDFRYDYALDHCRPVMPALNDAGAEWVQGILNRRGA